MEIKFEKWSDKSVTMLPELISLLVAGFFLQIFDGGGGGGDLQKKIWLKPKLPT